MLVYQRVQVKMLLGQDLQCGATNWWQCWQKPGISLKTEVSSAKNGNRLRKHGGVNYPPVIKHSNWKSPIYRWIFPVKPPFIEDFPLPRLITRWYLKKTQQPKNIYFSMCDMLPLSRIGFFNRACNLSKSSNRICMNLQHVHQQCLALNNTFHCSCYSISKTMAGIPKIAL